MNEDLVRQAKIWSGSAAGFAGWLSKYTAGIAEAVLLAVAGLLLLNIAIMESVDKGNGVWIGFVGPTPDMGWGAL